MRPADDGKSIVLRSSAASEMSDTEYTPYGVIIGSSSKQCKRGQWSHDDQLRQYTRDNEDHVNTTFFTSMRPPAYGPFHSLRSFQGIQA